MSHKNVGAKLKAGVRRAPNGSWRDYGTTLGELKRGDEFRIGNKYNSTYSTVANALSGALGISLVARPTEDGDTVFIREA